MSYRTLPVRTVTINLLRSFLVHRMAPLHVQHLPLWLLCPAHGKASTEIKLNTILLNTSKYGFYIHVHAIKQMLGHVNYLKYFENYDFLLLYFFSMYPFFLADYTLYCKQYCLWRGDWQSICQWENIPFRTRAQPTDAIYALQTFVDNDSHNNALN